MYLGYYNLNEPPFELTPNSKFLFLTSSQREALSNLEYGLFGAKAVTVLIGEVGTGKTTLLQAALESEQCRHVRCVFLTNPALTREEFIYMLATRFDMDDFAKTSKAALLERLEVQLKARRAQGEVTALVVDEAQRLSTELLEEVRLLANMETPTEKLLPLVLAGQPELATRLEEPQLRQLKQRVALRCEIAPFSLAETAAYIAGRITIAGGTPTRLFSREAVTTIYERSGGIPRTINVICDNALVSGMALDRQTVDRAIVMEVCEDFSLGRTLREPPPTAAVSAAPPSVPSAPPQALAMTPDTVAAGGQAPERRLGRRVPLFGAARW